MKLEFKVTLNAESLRKFTVGASFTQDEVLKYQKEFKSPENWTIQEVLQSAKYNWQEDFKHLQWWVKTRYTKLKYLVSAIKLDINRNLLYVSMVVSSPIFLGLALANTQPNNILTSQVAVKQEVKTQVEKVKKKTKKKVDKARAALKKEKKKLEEVRNLHRELQKELGILELPKKPLKPVSSIQITGITDVQIAQIKSVSGTIQSSELTRVKMFSSREDAIIGYYKEYLKSSNLNNSVNAITSIAQFIYEPGLKEDGTVSKLASIGNNGGIKKAVWRKGKLCYTRKLKGESEGMVMSKDDETNLSAFKTFSSIPDFMTAHADFLSTDRYKDYRKYAGINTEWAARQAARELAPDRAGYFTKEDGHKSLQNLISKVVVPTLKKHNLI